MENYGWQDQRKGSPVRRLYRNRPWERRVGCRHETVHQRLRLSIYLRSGTRWLISRSCPSVPSTTEQVFCNSLVNWISVTGGRWSTGMAGWLSTSCCSVDSSVPGQGHSGGDGTLQPLASCLTGDGDPLFPPLQQLQLWRERSSTFRASCVQLFRDPMGLSRPGCVSFFLEVFAKVFCSQADILCHNHL